MSGAMTVRDTQQAPHGIAALGGGQSVLGECEVAIPTSGRIRAGIKVLTAAAGGKPLAQELYAAGVAAGDSWDAIERRIVEALKLQRSPLTPKNVPYFTVRRGDFAMPEIADRIMELYGEDRGEGLHLYRFPCIFPVDAWQAILPHKLRAYTRAGLLYWSQYAADGARYCMTHGAVAVDERTQRAHRPFGGRPVVLRPDNEGRCEPDKCPQYQARQCNLSGRLLFYISQIPGLGAISLSTTSLYSMQQARQKLEMVAFITGGKVSGTFNGKSIFWITKKQQEISMLDPATGKPKRVRQWLIELEADIDMQSLFRAQERPTLEAAGSSAAALLEGASAGGTPIAASETDEDAEFSLPDEPAQDAEETEETAADDTPAPGEPQPEVPDVAAQAAEEIASLRRELYAAVQACGLSPEAFAQWAAREYADDWAHDAQQLRQALETARRARTDESQRQEILSAAASKPPF